MFSRLVWVMSLSWCACALPLVCLHAACARSLSLAAVAP